jgi:hypothetical protein
MNRRSKSDNKLVPRSKRRVREVQVQPVSVVPKAKAKPLPPGFKDAMISRQNLRRHLQDRGHEHFNVNLDVQDDHWVLVYRGTKGCGLEHWENLVVQQVPSRLVQQVG